ncbi:MAG: hypothetical protein ACXWKG_16740, partial [Limisphaerales bacterium]
LDCDFTTVTDCSGIVVGGGSGDKGDCADGYLANTGGGTITVEVDLPAGTFDVSGTAGPGDIYGPGATVDISDGTSSISGTGIVGPTTVYVLFLNQGSAITRAAGISISGDADCTPTEVCAVLDCDFTTVSDCSGITITGGSTEKGDCFDGYQANSAGGTLTFEVDLPCGTFDVSGTPGPGDIYGPGPTVDINDGTSSITPTGIVGPTTVYVSFLNQGSAVTRAAGICVSRY